MDVQITFRDMEPSDAVTKAVQDKADHLAKYYDRITRCHVVIEQPHKHQHQGRLFHVHIHVHLPGHEIAVAHEPEHGAHEDVYVSLRDAFAAAERQVKSHADKTRRDRRHG